MRLMSLNECTRDDDREVYRVDSVEHALFLHTRMWPYRAIFYNRAECAFGWCGDVFQIDIGMHGPESYRRRQFQQLAEATKIVAFPSKGGVTEIVALDPQENVVQVLYRAPLPMELADGMVRVTLRSFEDLRQDWTALTEAGDGVPRHFEELEGQMLELPFEVSDRYAELEFGVFRALQWGTGSRCSARVDLSHTVGLEWLLDDEDELTDIGPLVFPHPDPAAAFSPVRDGYGRGPLRERSKRRGRLGMKVSRRRRRRLV